MSGGIRISERVVGLQWVKAADLRDHPLNFRVHPEEQRKALRGALGELGNISAILAYRSAEEGGSWRIIDGHARKSVAPDHLFPVLELALTDEEAPFALATFDALGTMAAIDARQLAETLARVSVTDDALLRLLETMQGEEEHPAPAGQFADAPYTEQYGVTVLCDDERHQQRVYEALMAQGYTCKVVVV